LGISTISDALYPAVERALLALIDKYEG